MSSMVPSEACSQIANTFEEFVHHKKEWRDVLVELEDTMNTVCANVYAVGYSDGKDGKPENPMQIDDWRWRLQVHIPES